MDESNNVKPIKNDDKLNSISKIIQHRPSLFNKTKVDKFSMEKSQNEKSDNFEKSISLLKLFSSRSQYMKPENYKIFPDFAKKGKTTSFTAKNYLIPIQNTKINSIINNKINNLYLTSYKINKNQKLKKCSSTYDLDDKRRKSNMIDLIHEKEIGVCLDLIKSLPDKTRNKTKNLNVFKLNKSEETNNLIKSIKFFTIDNITNQRIIEHQILNNNNYNPKFNSELNTLNNTLSLSMATNYKTNNTNNKALNNMKNNFNNFNISNYSNYNNINNNMSNFNISNYSNNNNNLNNSLITIKNYGTITKNLGNKNLMNINNSFNSSLNENNTKSKMKKSISNKINNITNNNIKKKLENYQKNSINFRTGFVRSKKNIYGDEYSNNFKNLKNNNEIKIKNYKKKKEDANKLLLPEIEEFKTIIKDIENRKSKTLRKKNSDLNDINDDNDILLKDKLIEELNKIYLNQKHIFLKNLKENISNRRIYAELYKKKVNENIQDINKIKRGKNIYVDGYSLLDGKINQKLNQYNYILGNRFFDKDKKMEKVEKLCKISEEYENEIKNNENGIFQETNLYNQYYKPKFYFNNKEIKEDLLDDIKLKMERNIPNRPNQRNKTNTINSNFNSNSNITVNSSKSFKFDNIKNASISSNQEEKVYNDYINFRRECKKKYSFDEENI